MGFSRNEDILQAIVDGTSSSELPNPQSREERLLHAILDKINAGGGGGSGGPGLSIHICSANEYDAVTGIPTVASPSETTFYLVPASDDGNDLYDEWVYVDGNWEKFGSRGSVSGMLSDLSDVTIAGVDDKQALVYDTTTNRWKNVALNSVCFIQEGEEDFILDGGDASDLT